MRQFELKFYATIALHAKYISHAQIKTKLQKSGILKDKVYILTTELHSIQKDQYHRPQKKTHI